MEKIDKCLYIVATPIGNLNEMTPRAIYILQNVDLIACEDTRQTLKLLSHFEISKPLISCHEHNETSTTKNLIEEIKKGKAVAMVSDAGYPGISDPGSILIHYAIEANIKINVISGPCAIINALVGSGLPSDHFYFHGFLHNKNTQRKEELLALSIRRETIILYESPHRLIQTLNELLLSFGNRQICVCRELTKLHEEYKRCSIEEAIYYFKDEVRGEIVLVIEGNHNKEEETISEYIILEEINGKINQGISAKDAIKEVADKYNLPKNDIYRLYHQ